MTTYKVDDYIQEIDDYTWKTNDTHATRNMYGRRKNQLEASRGND
jgi:hypothetical protein